MLHFSPIWVSLWAALIFALLMGGGFFAHLVRLQLRTPEKGQVSFIPLRVGLAVLLLALGAGGALGFALTLFAPGG